MQLHIIPEKRRKTMRHYQISVTLFLINQKKNFPSLNDDGGKKTSPRKIFFLINRDISQIERDVRKSTEWLNIILLNNLIIRLFCFLITFSTLLWSCANNFPFYFLLALWIAVIGEEFKATIMYPPTASSLCWKKIYCLANS